MYVVSESFGHDPLFDVERTAACRLHINNHFNSVYLYANLHTVSNTLLNKFDHTIYWTRNHLFTLYYHFYIRIAKLILKPSIFRYLCFTLFINFYATPCVDKHLIHSLIGLGLSIKLSV